MNGAESHIADTDAKPDKWLDWVGTYWSLIFSLFYFIGVLAFPHSTATLVFLLGIYAIQVVLYHFMATAKRQSVSLASIGLSIFFSILSCSENISGYAFFWFCTYAGAFRFRLHVGVAIYGAVIAAVALSAELFNHDLWFYFSALIPATGLFVVGLFEKIQHQHREQQKRSNEEIEQLAQVAERERIARDLHDLMGHSLTTIALKAQLADKLAQAGDTEAAVKEINEVASVTSETLSQMRSVITGYKAKSLNAVIESLESSLQKWNFDVENTLSLPVLNSIDESTLALVLTEAVTNIIKHSKGKSVRLWNDINKNDAELDAWVLHIHDDGVVTQNPPVFGNGLAGMSERLNSVNADLKIATQDGFHIAIQFNGNNK